jgi:hypothetical protein
MAGANAPPPIFPSPKSQEASKIFFLKATYIWKMATKWGR